MSYILNAIVEILLDGVFIYLFTFTKEFLARPLWWGWQFILFSLGYWFAINLFKANQEKVKILKKLNEYEDVIFKMEDRMRKAQISSLEWQINSHFLFNTLNFFYDQIQPHSNLVGEGILRLSNIMRYALNGSEANAKVMLETEVDHLKNYIEIYQLRFGYKLKIDFLVIGDLKYRMVAPFILITFVENCFKHGELMDSKTPLKVRLVVNNDTLFFYSFNRKKVGPIACSPGIGLVNTRKRLEAIYKDEFHLNLQESESFYTTNLIIKL